ncbi:acyl-CoA dehydrogenase N-terminal domain-containing protein, partial [Burkholderia ubonensis]
MSYTAPVKDMLFVLKELAGIDAVAQLPGFEDAFRQFVEGGWQGLQHPAEYDGQGL